MQSFNNVSEAAKSVTSAATKYCNAVGNVKQQGAAFLVALYVTRRDFGVEEAARAFLNNAPKLINVRGKKESKLFALIADQIGLKYSNKTGIAATDPDGFGSKEHEVAAQALFTSWTDGTSDAADRTPEEEAIKRVKSLIAYCEKHKLDLNDMINKAKS